MKVTIIIPTRERAETLASTIQTCLMQEYEPLEILVSDNFSADNTRDVVESFADKRIRCLNTGERLSMTGNWEFALSHVKEGFVTFVGDDDGILPHAIKDSMEIIKTFSLSALAWKKAEYTWPSYIVAGLKNLLIVPRLNFLLRLSTKKVVRDCTAFLLGYNFCPCVYNSLVEFSVLSRIRKRTGKFFHSVIPDVYSGLAIASEIDSYFFSTRPFSLNGASGKSQGTGFQNFSKSKEKAEHPVAQFIKENDLPMHPQMPMLIPGVGVSAILEPMLQANDRCFGGRLEIDFRMALRRAFKEMSSLDPAVFREAVSKLESVFRGSKHLGFIGKCKKRFKNNPVLPVTGINEKSNRFEVVLDASKESVKTVYEAVLLADANLPPFSIPATIYDYSRFSLLFFLLGPKIFRFLPSWLQGEVSGFT